MLRTAPLVILTLPALAAAQQTSDVSTGSAGAGAWLLVVAVLGLFFALIFGLPAWRRARRHHR